MNQKSSVSKEQNNKHLKILEGVVRLPENRECADCCSKAPRWASVNLGIFICMQCSGIHRSLGTHISKVRSTTLDTWLPEQVAFMQAMSNQKSNAYWEANLPPNYDRSNNAEFIRAKYVERRWIPKDGTPPPTVIASKKISSSSSKMGDQDDIPKKTRKLSLDEGILTKHEPEVVPPPAAARIRRSSLDMYNLASASAPPRGRGANAPIKPANGSPDISKTFAPTPELWATFDF